MVLCRKFRPERLQFHHGCPAAAPPATCAQAARMAAAASGAANCNNGATNVNTALDISGGFANFAAAYPQYCESRCCGSSEQDSSTAASQQQHGSRHQPLLVEPNYDLNQGPTQLLSFLYVGSQSDACSAEFIRTHGITHVLNVSATCAQSEHVPVANFMRIPVNDGYADKLLPHFKHAFQFIDNVRRSNGRCLVHCLAGVSRSPTLTIAYIMQHLRYSQDEAYRYVKSRRPSISPNFNFLGQLLEFERQMKRRFAEEASDGSSEPSSSSSGSNCPPASTIGDSSSSGSGEDDCSSAKRQRRHRFRLTLPAGSAGAVTDDDNNVGVVAKGSSPTSALSRLTFVKQQQQQAQQNQEPETASSVAAPTDAVATASASAASSAAELIQCS